MASTDIAEVEARIRLAELRLERLRTARESLAQSKRLQEDATYFVQQALEASRQRLEAAGPGASRFDQLPAEMKAAMFRRLFEKRAERRRDEASRWHRYLAVMFDAVLRSLDEPS